MSLISFLTKIRHRTRFVVGPLLGISALAYFAYHTVQGDRGIFAWWRLHREVSMAELSLSKLEAERNHLSQQAQLLRPDRIDADMLEERARIMLNMGRDDEVIIFRPRS